MPFESRQVVRQLDWEHQGQQEGTTTELFEIRKNPVKFVGLHYQMALLQCHYHLNNHKDNSEAHLSEQSVKECNSSLLLMIDSHHQQIALTRPIDHPFNYYEV